MDQTNMSTHSLPALSGGLRVRFHTLWTLSLKAYRRGSSRPDPLAGKILMQVAATILCGRTFKPSLGALGRMHGRSTRTIARAVEALEGAGFVETIQRGKKLSNVYRLAMWLWRRLTGRDGPTPPRRAGLQSAQSELPGIIARARAKWEAAQGEVALAGR